MRDRPLRQISEEDIAAFHRDGAVLLKGVLSGDWVDVLLEDDEPEAAAAPAVAAEDGAQTRGDAAAQAGDAETAGEQPSDEAASQAAAAADAARAPPSFLNSYGMLFSDYRDDPRALMALPVSLANRLLLGLFLGAVFTAIQAYEYAAAPFEFGGNTYSSAFYMATGFHGFHVLVGTIFLIVCLVRTYKGHFTPRQHFGFEAAAWYWHFVDVVWLFLFITVYVWGGWGAAVH